MEIIETARNYIASGLSVIPVKADKRPAIAWKPYQEKPMLNGEIERNFSLSDVTGIAAICGKVSGNLEVIDVDCKYDLTGHLINDFLQLIEDNIPEIKDSLVIAKTINKGFHLYYRCDKIEGNKKLATRSILPDEKKDSHDNNRVLIETRGKGGYVIAAPSPGYEFIKGNPANILQITIEQREILFAIARTFNEQVNNFESFGKTTFDDFNEKADVIGLLSKHGWKISRETNSMIELTRPGKDKGTSATYFKNKKILYVFSTSTPFESEKGYNPAGVFTVLECSGNFSDASRKLNSEGYGEHRPAKKENKPDPEPEPVTPLLPIEGMPDFIQHFISQMEGIYRTPRDYWAGAVIIATALAIGDKMELSTKYKNNPILWGMFIGDVSNGKTEPLDACLRYFRKFDAKSINQHHLSLAEFDRIRSLTKQERENEGIDEIPVKPDCFQYLLTDTTAEGMADAHRINKRGLLINYDELKGWIDNFGRYSNSGEQSNMLSMWSQKGVTYNRKTSGILNIEKPCILVAGGMHRELLHTLATDNRAENGFMARMIAFFPDNTEKQLYNNAIPDPALLKAWDEYIQMLTGIELSMTLILPDQTAKLYEAWYNDNVQKINVPGTSPYLKGVYGKLDIIVLRIAIVLRGMNFQLEGISTPGILPREMEAAIQITEYFRITAIKVYRQIFGERKFGEYDKKDIAAWLTKHTNLTKVQIANQVLNSSRSQLDRLIVKTPRQFK
jgi:hypothetical protein